MPSGRTRWGQEQDAEPGVTQGCDVNGVNGCRAAGSWEMLPEETFTGSSGGWLQGCHGNQAATNLPMIYHEFCFGWVNGSPASGQRAAGGLWVPKQCCGSSVRRLAV